MPFGVSNAPATFQRLLNNLFSEEYHENISIYLDDILISSKTVKEGLHILKKCVEPVEQGKPKIKRGKMCLL